MALLIKFGNKVVLILVKVKGVEIELNGQKYILPPLPIKAFSKGDASAKLKKINDDMRNINDDGLGAITAESWSNLVELVVTALRRNYPDIEAEEVENGFEDVTALMGVMQNLVSQSTEFKDKVELERKNATEKFLEHKKKA